mgnify:CR=1 FL=1
MTIVEVALLSLLYLSLKHFVVEYVWHTQYEILNLSNWKHPARYQHAFKHILLSPVAYAMITYSWWWLLLALFVEFLSHLMIDNGREHLQNGINEHSNHYRNLSGLAQFGHMCVYISVIAFLVLYSPIGLQGI